MSGLDKLDHNESAYVNHTDVVEKTAIEVQRLKEKCERQADLIERLTAQNGNLQYEKREVVRLSDQAFKVLGQIRSE